jgi:hypothetical protein
MLCRDPIESIPAVCRAMAIAISSILLAVPALAATGSSGDAALALAALVSEHSPTLHPFDKVTVANLFAGNTNVKYPPGNTITINADQIVCKASDVDITLHSCALTFGSNTIAMSERRAHEMYATLIENGVPGKVAAGTLFQAISQLSCTIDPNTVDQRAGGGATRNFTPQP